MEHESLEEILADVDYTRPLGGLESNPARFRFQISLEHMMFGGLTTLLGEVCLTAIPLYYSLKSPEFFGTRFIKYQAGDYLAVNAVYFVPGFLFGLAASHNKKVREGIMRKGYRSRIESVYNAVFEHPEIIAIPAAVGFYKAFNSYASIDNQPENILALVAYANDIFKSCIVGITTYCMATVAGSFLHSESLGFFKNAALSRLFEATGDYDRAAKYQKRIVDQKSGFSAKNRTRLGNLYLKAGKILEAIDEYGYFLRKHDSEKEAAPSDVLEIPLKALAWFFPEQKEYSSTNPMEIAGKIHQGALYFRKGLLKDADAAFREAICFDQRSRLPHIVYSHFLYSIGMDKIGDFEQKLANAILHSSPEFMNDLAQVTGTRNIVYIETVRL